MGMSNPHNPEIAMWNAYMEWMGAYAKNKCDKASKETGEYYLDQWFKVCERRLQSRALGEMTLLPLKQTPADRIKVKTKQS